jgi:hypothetical protein
MGALLLHPVILPGSNPTQLMIIPIAATPVDS